MDRHIFDEGNHVVVGGRPEGDGPWRVRGERVSHNASEENGTAKGVRPFFHPTYANDITPKYRCFPSSFC